MDAVDPIATSMQNASRWDLASDKLTLDDLSQGAIRTERIKSDLREGGKKFLSLATELQMDSSLMNASEVTKPKNLDPSDRVDTFITEMKGDTGGSPTDQSEKVLELLREVYISTAKLGVAWKVIEGVGKDTKMMLQAQ